MRHSNLISSMFASVLIMLLCFVTGDSLAQTKSEFSMFKDCCIMKDGKMMVMNDGKMTPMEKDMIMKNGNKCMVNGECVMANGEKIKMKEGECMDMEGNMPNRITN